MDADWMDLLDEKNKEIERLQKQIRYQEHRDGQKSPDYYLHIPMACITALASKEISAKAWPLALWVLWQYRVSGGKPVTISTTFAQKAGVEGRSARRHAVNALEATGVKAAFQWVLIRAELKESE